MRTGIFCLLMLIAIQANALEGIETLEKQIIDNNPALKSLENEIKASENMMGSSYAAYYPSFNAVAGLAEHTVDDPLDREKGYFGYLEGRLNLFNGFKDMAFINQKNIQFQLRKIQYTELKKNLTLKLTEVVSEMIYLHKLQNILATEEKITKEQKQMAAKKVASGLTSSVDYLEFELREEELRIQQRQINQLHIEAHQKILQLYGTDVDDKAFENLAFSKLETLTEVRPLNLDGNVNVRKARLNLKLAQLATKEAKAGYLPTLDFIFSSGRITPSEDDLQLAESSYKLQLTIPLFSGFETSYRAKAAQAQTLAQRFEENQTSFDSMSLHNSLAEKTKELNDLYIINERKLITSQKYFDLTVAEYKRGIKNSPDLVGATERWFSSQKRKFELIKELELTKVKIENLYLE